MQKKYIITIFILLYIVFLYIVIQQMAIVQKKPTSIHTVINKQPATHIQQNDSALFDQTSAPHIGAYDDNDTNALSKP